MVSHSLPSTTQRQCWFSRREAYLDGLGARQRGHGSADVLQELPHGGCCRDHHSERRNPVCRLRGNIRTHVHMCVCVSDCRGWMRGASGRAATVPLLTNENLTAVVPGSPCLASGSNAGGQPA